jgi:hypothetical protein
MHAPGTLTHLAWFMTDNASTRDCIALIHEVRALMKVTYIQKSSFKANKQTLSQLKKSFIESIVELRKKTQSDTRFAASYLFNLQTDTLIGSADPDREIAQLKRITLKDLHRVSSMLLSNNRLSWVELGKENHLN